MKAETDFVGVLISVALISKELCDLIEFFRNTQSWQFWHFGMALTFVSQQI